MNTFNLQPTGPISLSAAIEIGPPDRSSRYLSVAVALASGVRALLERPEASTALAFLSAQVVETSLKSYILKVDPSADVRSPPANHDLVALWVRCAKAGLAVNPVVPQSIKLLGALHSKPYPLRYSDEEKVRLLCMPDLRALVGEIEGLLQLVSKAVK